MTAISRVKNRPTSRIMVVDATVAVDDLVYQDTVTANTALKIVNNFPPTPGIGMVISKPTATSAEVVLLGEVNFTIGQGNLWIGLTGQLSISTAIPTGYIQRFGFSFGDGKIFIEPSQNRIKRN